MRPPAVAHDAEHNRQAQAGVLGAFLRSKERLEQVAAGAFVDALARIANLKLYFRLAVDVTRFNRQGAP